MSRLAPYRLSRGVSMLEVLIAIGLLTLGMLGVAPLQFRMQNADLVAYQRTQAALLGANETRRGAQRVRPAITQKRSRVYWYVDTDK